MQQAARVSDADRVLHHRARRTSDRRTGTLVEYDATAKIFSAPADERTEGVLLAIARAAGETAPLLFAVGAATAYNPDLFHEANTALSLQIFGNATSAFPAAQDRAWGAALTLVLLTFIVTLIARVFTSRRALKR